jgi:hypothetical protein
LLHGGLRFLIGLPILRRRPLSVLEIAPLRELRVGIMVRSCFRQCRRRLRRNQYRRLGLGVLQRPGAARAKTCLNGVARAAASRFGDVTGAASCFHRRFTSSPKVA